MQSGLGDAFAVEAGSLLVILPDIPHAYGPGPRETWSEFYIVFQGPVFDLWRQAGFVSERDPVHHLPRMSHWLPRLEACVRPAPGLTMLQRVVRLQSFLGEIVRAPAKPGPSPIPWLEKAILRLQARPPLPVRTIARSLGLSHEFFRKEFARHTGLPPHRYRLHHLIGQARNLIAQGNLSNKQLAETLGFCDEFHFSRRFRQVVGLSTREYRRRLASARGTLPESQPVPLSKNR